MKQLSLSRTQDVLALVVRRRWWLLGPFVALSCAVVLFTHMLPRMYVSDTLILIRSRDVPEDFVKNLIAGSTEQRLHAIEQTVLSRTNLIQILLEFEGGMPEYAALNVDQKVLKLRDTIKVVIEVENSGGVRLPLSYFRVSHRNNNPELAQRITTKLAALFIEQDSRAREDQVSGTTEFLNAEMDKVGMQLQESETKLKQLKERRRYELPDQLETNLRTLDRLGLQQQSNGEALDRTATTRLNLELQISETAPVILKPSAGGAGPIAASNPPIAASNPPIAASNPLVEDYRKKEVVYEQLAAMFTPRHPEVQAAKAALERLQAKIPQESFHEPKRQETAPVAETMPNPVYQNLTAQLKQVQTEFQIREDEKKWIESQIAEFSRRVQATPDSEQEISNILRENTELNKQYADLKKNLAQAKLSESLESRQRGSQFVIVDPANYPLLPTQPAKPKIVMMGILLSLLAGIGFALAVDLFSQRIWTPSELESIFAVVVLAEIPPIVTNTDLVAAKRKKRIVAASSVAGAVAYGVVLYFAYLNQSFVLQKLDPLVQRLMQ